MRSSSHQLETQICWNHQDDTHERTKENLNKNENTPRTVQKTKTKTKVI